MLYLPKPFEDPDWDRNLAVIDAHPFGLLIQVAEGRPMLSPAPFLLDRRPDGTARLRCHLARPNPGCGLIDGERPASVLFQGPGAYISPDWYESDGMVPTWNYVAVEAGGTPRLLDDDGLLTLLADLSAREETHLAPKPAWTLDKLSQGQLTGLMKAIIGFEMGIEALSGKHKLSQNRKTEDRTGAADGLERRGRPNDLAVTALMRSILPAAAE